MRRVPPAVYRCAVPGRASHTDSAPTPSPAPHAPPFPAWPDIEAWRTWLCLPPLWRAEYYPRRPPPPSRPEHAPDGLPLPDEEYLLAHEERFDPADLQNMRTVDAILRRQQAAGIRDVAAFGRAARAAWVGPFEQTRSVAPFYQSTLFARGLAGRTPEELFNDAHESAHWDTAFLGTHSARRQEAQSRKIHALLDWLVATPDPGAAALRRRWRAFDRENHELARLVERYAPIEEIAANFLAYTYLPPEIGAAVMPAVIGVMRQDGFEEGHHGFVAACEGDDPISDAVSLLDLSARAADHFGVPPLDALVRTAPAYFHAIRRGEKLVRDPALTGDRGERAPFGWDDLAPIVAARDEEEGRTRRRQPRATVLLIGSEEGIDLDISCEPRDAEAVHKRIVLESLRQQLSHGTGFHCPLKRGDVCCGRSEWLRALWARLPEEDRPDFLPPSCGAVA